ncbi:hypothetical protein [Prevotella sp. tf2-5]|uniref:hypothetical protein n=1 Tax=Prevotella sp. tf2-5 TaxID=1761889 RepID=UPI0008E2741D|nr:hypothetical protein [Prevotella sp. tf2-5]SFO81954.1 hypothetical protein SAMN04487852_10894 [Prevotella sp. tf2-5]
MKSKNILITGLLMLLPSAVLAQQHIQQAFDALRNSNIKEISSRHSVEKDPDLGTMEGLEDTYDFELTDNRDKRLIDNIRKAFELDEAHAYSVSTGSNGNSEDFVSLAVGDSNKGGVAIGLIKDSKWIYACFLDPNDTLRQHRYAYALEWAENGNKIRGRIVKTYATTLKFRQEKKQSRTITVNGNNFAFGSFFSDADTKPSETWLSEFNTYKNLFLKNPDGTAANSYATQIYRLCKDTKSLEDVEKNIVATEIVKLKKKTKDEFIQQLFDMSIERLKK